MNDHRTEDINRYLLELQEQICQALEREDGHGRFHEDAWQRPQGGGGRSRVLSNGAVFEQAGINYSRVQGDQLPPSATANRPELAGRTFEAMGVSLVIHPLEPVRPYLACQRPLILWPENPVQPPSGGLEEDSTSRPIMGSKRTQYTGIV